eukprot:scaffold12.g7930.t1
MQSNLHSKEITNARVSAVSFGFFTDEEVRKISCKRIVSPIIFDNLKHAVKGGLYDPAMGPMEPRERCVTCGLSAFECPGHFGHIELAVPLYNPLVFLTLYKLLRCTCLHCFEFRMAGAEVERFRRRLELLSQGRLVDAQAVLVGTSATAKRKGGELIDEAMEMEDLDTGEARAWDYSVEKGVADSAAKAGAGLGPRSPGVVTAQTLEAMIDTISAFFKRQPTTGKCQNCGANNPTVKREGTGKLFIMPLPAKKRAANAVQGTPILSALARLSDEAAAVEELEAQLAARQQQRAARRKREPEADAKGEGAAGEKEEGRGSEEEEESKAGLEGEQQSKQEAEGGGGWGGESGGEDGGGGGAGEGAEPKATLQASKAKRQKLLEAALEAAG